MSDESAHKLVADIAGRLDNADWDPTSYKLRLDEIARDLDIHESTVYRVASLLFAARSEVESDKMVMERARR